MAMAYHFQGGPNASGYGMLAGNQPGQYSPVSNADPMQQAFDLKKQQEAIAGQTGIAQIGAEAAKYPATLQHSRFNTVFPWLKGQLAGLQDGINSTSSGSGSGAGTPSIRVGGVYNPQQIQQQVNASNAAIDRTTGTQNAQAAQQSGSRGFGSNSPLLMALQGQNNASGLAAKVQGENQLRTSAAGMNAQQQLASQQAAAGAYGQRQQESIQRRGQSLSAYASLLSALSGLV